MEDKKILIAFYNIANELDKNILKFNELELQLKEAKANNDLEKANELLKSYKKVANNIKILKKQSEKLKEEAN
jgi:hypothetical protein